MTDFWFAVADFLLRSGRSGKQVWFFCLIRDVGRHCYVIFTNKVQLCKVAGKGVQVSVIGGSTEVIEDLWDKRSLTLRLNTSWVCDEQSG